MDVVTIDGKQYALMGTTRLYHKLLKRVETLEKENELIKMRLNEFPIFPELPSYPNPFVDAPIKNHINC